MPLLPQFGFFELMLVAAIALVVVGPNDLPKLLRSVGQLGAQARRMANEFRAAFDEMAHETELKEMREELETLRTQNAFSQARKDIEDAVKPVSDALSEETKNINAAVAKGAGAGAAAAGVATANAASGDDEDEYDETQDPYHQEYNDDDVEDGLEDSENAVGGLDDDEDDDLSPAIEPPVHGPVKEGRSV